MDTSSSLWSWIIDSRCYSALQNVQQFCKKDVDRVITDLMEIANGLCYNKATLKNAKRHLDNGEVDDLSNRILLACLAIRIYLGKEPYHFFCDDDTDNKTTLKSVLDFIHKLKYCFDSESYDLFHKMWLATFKQELVFLDSETAMQSYKDTVITRYKDEIPNSVLKLCSVPTELRNSSDVDIFYFKYIIDMLDCISKLNSTLTKPFLLKVEEKVGNVLENNDIQVPLSTAQHVCQLLNSQLLNIDRGKDAKELENSINLKNINLDFLSDTEISSINTACNSCEKNLVLHADDADEYYSASSSKYDDVNKESFEENHCISDKESIAVTNVLNNESISDSENPIADVTRQRVWSFKLDSYIILGVKRFGVGSWQKIKNYYPFPSLNTGTHIKDRWRTMIRKKLVEIDEDKNLKYIDPCYEDYLQNADKRFQKKLKGGKHKAKVLKQHTFVEHKHTTHNSNGCEQASMISETSKMKTRKLSVSQQHSVTKRAWTSKLDGYIILGIIAFGVGSWTKIKNSFPFPGGKHAGHIKDRWRTLIKQKLVEVQPGKVVYSSSYKNYVSEAKKHLKILTPQLSYCLSAGLLKQTVSSCSKDTVVQRTTRSKMKK